MRRTFGFEWLRRCGALALALTCSLAAQAQTHAQAQSHGKVYYYYTDALHSAVVETDAAGTVLERTYYAPFGSVLNRSLRNGPGYTGHEEDAATGLVYMQQRYYDPQAGRFISVDPVQVTANGGNFNRYWYAQDNPYRYTDPDGRDVTAFIGGLFVETAHWVGGQGFNGSAVIGALKDGYNGQGDGIGHALLEDAGTISAAAGIAGIVKGGAALIASRFAAKEAVEEGADLVAGDVGKEIGILRDAVSGKGNFGLGSGTRAEAEKLGKAWVGDDFTVAKDGKTLVSKDKLRQYRPPSYKPKVGKTQANFERRLPDQKSNGWQSNGHLDIED